MLSKHLGLRWLFCVRTRTLSGNSSWSWEPVFPLAGTTLSALPPAQDGSPGCAEAMRWEGSGIRVRPGVGRRLLDTLTLRD